MKHQYFFYLFASFFFFNIATAQNNTSVSELTIGDSAPQLKIESWIKNGGFPVFEKGKIYLIDLWATWCVPCIAGMPHLSELQKKYKAKGLEVIGITSEDKYGNTLQHVKDFVLKKDSVMNYNVAWVASSVRDSEEGIWLHPWMQKSGSGNLPTSFLIDKNGRIVYIGDPSTIDATLEQVISGDYDMNEFKAAYLSGMQAENVLSKFNQSIKANNTDSAIVYGRQLLTNFSYVKPNTYLVMGWQVAHINGNIDSQLLQLGYDATIRGMKLTGFSSPAFFDVLAAIHAAKKDYVSAIVAERAATGISEGDMKKNQTKNLEKYIQLAMQNKND